MNMFPFQRKIPAQNSNGAFAFPDLLAVLAGLMLLLAIALPLCSGVSARSRLAQCTGNLRQITGAVLSVAGQNNGRLPEDNPEQKSLAGPPAGVWWFYKEAIKGELQLKGFSSPADKVF